MNGAVEKRYVDALLELWEEGGRSLRFVEQTEAVRDRLEKPEMAMFFKQPSVALEDRLEVLLSDFGAQVDENLKGFLHLLLKDERVRMIVPILSKTLVEANRRLGRVIAWVVSAKPLSETQEQAIHDALVKELDLEIDLITKVDTDVIGGLYILVEGKVLDLTIRTELNRLKHSLMRGDPDASQA